MPEAQGAIPAPDPIISLVMLALFIVIIAFVIVLWWRIFAKAGYHGALGLLMLVPIVNLVLMVILAFKEWPIQKKLRELGK